FVSGLFSGSIEEYAIARRNEVCTSLALAGVPADAIECAGVADQEAIEHIEALVDAVRNAIGKHSPSVVITTAYEGGHPDHDAAALAVSIATAGRAVEMPLYHNEPGHFVTGSFIGH